MKCFEFLVSFAFSVYASHKKIVIGSYFVFGLCLIMKLKYKMF